MQQWFAFGRGTAIRILARQCAAVDDKSTALLAVRRMGAHLNF